MRYQDRDYTAYSYTLLSQIQQLLPSFAVLLGFVTGAGEALLKRNAVLASDALLGGALPVILPNLYVYEHYSLGSPGKKIRKASLTISIFAVSSVQPVLSSDGTGSDVRNPALSSRKHQSDGGNKMLPLVRTLAISRIFACSKWGP